MSENETKPEVKAEVEEKTDVKLDVIDDNVALLKAKILNLEKERDADKALIEELTNKLEQATEFIEGDQKKLILAEVSPMVDIPDEHLMLKSLDELKAMKKILDVANIPAFKSGTPFNVDKKPTSRAKLGSAFDDYMTKTYGGKK